MTAAKQSISPEKQSDKLKVLNNEFESQIKTFLTGIREQSEEVKQTLQTVNSPVLDEDEEEKTGRDTDEDGINCDSSNNSVCVKKNNGHRQG